jgi:hypothetical protein
LRKSGENLTEQILLRVTPEQRIKFELKRGQLGDEETGAEYLRRMLDARGAGTAAEQAAIIEAEEQAENRRHRDTLVQIADRRARLPSISILEDETYTRVLQEFEKFHMGNDDREHQIDWLMGRENWTREQAQKFLAHKGDAAGECRE